VIEEQGRKVWPEGWFTGIDHEMPDCLPDLWMHLLLVGHVCEDGVEQTEETEGEKSILFLVSGVFGVCCALAQKHLMFIVIFLINFSFSTCCCTSIVLTSKKPRALPTS